MGGGKTVEALGEHRVDAVDELLHRRLSFAYD
jgi:hypothetical protein